MLWIKKIKIKKKKRKDADRTKGLELVFGREKRKSEAPDHFFLTAEPIDKKIFEQTIKIFAHKLYM